MSAYELSVFYCDAFRESVEVETIGQALAWLASNWSRLSTVSGCWILYDSLGEICRCDDWQAGDRWPGW